MLLPYNLNIYQTQGFVQPLFGPFFDFSCVELKRDDTAQAALAQIDSKDYALPFIADSRKLYKIGVAFDSESRMLKDWEVSE